MDEAKYLDVERKEHFSLVERKVDIYIIISRGCEEREGIV